MELSERSEAALENVLQESGNIQKFLDSVFVFLKKRTDFFIECPPSGGNLGFPPGQAINLVKDAFVKARDFGQGQGQGQRVAQEQKNKPPSPEVPQGQIEKCSASSSSKPKEEEAYNGQVTDKYSWSQTISEVDVRVPVPPEVKKGKDVAVDIRSGSISVRWGGKGKDEEAVVVAGPLTWPVRKEDSYWNLLPGDSVHLFLQKEKERWWQALLEGEKLLETSQIDAVRPMEELDEEERMKLQELCWNQERKLKGLPTSEELKMHKVLEKAWNADGSPFKGMPVDMSKVEFSPPGQGGNLPRND